MNSSQKLIDSAMTAIRVGDVYRDVATKIEVLSLSPLEDIIWFDDGVMHVITPSLHRMEFLAMVAGLEKLPSSR